MATRPHSAVDLERVFERAVVAKTCRLLYVPTTKVLSTSMLWMLASAEGDPDSRTLASVIGSTRAQTVHDPLVHQLPMLSGVSRAIRSEALTSSRWMRLGITRDPYARLHSAWQHKILLQTPGQLAFHPPDFAFDRMGALDVGASFRAFVRFLDENWHAVTADQHFWTQVDSLAIGKIDYTDLFRLDRLDELLTRLARHAPALARPLLRYNESPSIDYRRCYDAETAAIVARRYRADFEVLGYDATQPAPLDGPVVLDPLAQDLLNAVHQRNQRIDMIRKGAGIRWELVRQRRALRNLLVRFRPARHS